MTAASQEDWDHSVDLLVVGSGAGAMTAGIVAHDRGADVLLIEKSDRYGGSSAMSGGALWIPNNHFMTATDIHDSPEDAMDYLRSITEGMVSEERLRAYVDEAPDTLEYLCEKTHLDVECMSEYADYYPAAPGSKLGARTVEPKRFAGKRLGNEYRRLRDQGLQCLIMGRVAMTSAEARVMLCRSAGWLMLAFRLMLNYALDIPWRLRSRRDRTCTMGNGLIAPLRLSLLDREVPLWLETPARELIEEDGRVTGVVAEKDGRRVRIRARKGVILAAGGFEGNQSLREKYLPGPTRAEWTCANPANEGDAIVMGEALGSGLALMDDAWWGPTTVVPREDRARMLVVEKSLPGGILVNKRGQRFVNEAAPYVDVVKVMHEKDRPEAPTVPSYLIFDATFRKSYPVGPFLQASQQPDFTIPRRLKKAKYLKKAGTLRELAGQLGIDADGLEATVEKFNNDARDGKDPEFQRGETLFDRYYGDAEATPNPCLRAIETAPFYAIEVFPGELGTKGGLTTDERARVLREDGRVIDGLYAVGNCSASVMGPTYAGAGATIGPAITFGYIAARHALTTR
ncbi:MAG: FAD-dependent oxidoreductase [Deltaproteobacteria bacterium]|nr:FAD-dependent oxidoreductase [Deltaproteobacteria bacterium]MBW2419447.1 FAD-dependent oxidoreductase [Deltaproteobacteria bacterium]